VRLVEKRDAPLAWGGGYMEGREARLLSSEREEGGRIGGEEEEVQGEKKSRKERREGRMRRKRILAGRFVGPVGSGVV